MSGVACLVGIVCELRYVTFRPRGSLRAGYFCWIDGQALDYIVATRCCHNLVAWSLAQRDAQIRGIYFWTSSFGFSI